MTCLILIILILNKGYVRYNYLTELQLKMANFFGTEAFTILNVIVSFTIYNKRVDFNFEIVNSSLLDRAVPRPHYYVVNIFRSLFVLWEYVLMLVTSTI